LTLPVGKYLARHGLSGPWSIERANNRDWRNAVVIPALAERDSLFLTLDSLATNPRELLAQTLALVVVNQRVDATAADRQDNLATLDSLQCYAASTPLQLGWVDAATPGKELPEDRGGVGMARKIGFDLVLHQVAAHPDGFIASLDADTLVRPDYLPALEAHFSRTPAGAATIPYCHQAAGDPAQQIAIDSYELFLRHYVLGLMLAGSPYAYHSIGSSLAFSPQAYLKAGGMNLRQAGEDFYLLQQLQKTSGVRQLGGTVVYPSARLSARTPFGTGERVARQLQGEGSAVEFYAAGCFRILAAWLQLLSNNLDASGEQLLQQFTTSSPEACRFLQNNNFLAAWQRLQQNHPQPQQRLGAFHGWFDALRTLRLIHHLSATSAPRCAAEPALTPLLHWAGWPTVDKPAAQLVLLRSKQTGEDAPEAHCPLPSQPRL